MSNKLINFFKGYASNFLHPRDDVREAYNKVLKESDFDSYDLDPDNQHPLNYGTDPGSLEVRQTIADFLAEKFSINKFDPDCLNLTNGASYGIGITLNRATDPSITKKIFIVSPCYYLINFAFVDAGFAGNITAVNETPEAEYQIDFDFLEAELNKLDQQIGTHTKFQPDPLGRESSRVYSSVIYIVPTFSNPGGLRYSEATKLRLLGLARKHNMLIICDDVYDLLDYTGNKPLPRLVHIDRDTLPEGDEYGHVVSNSSTSKIISPGSRFGWHETATPKLSTIFSQQGCVKSGGTPSQLTSYAVKELIDSGKLDGIIENYITHYSERAEVAKKAIDKYLPDSTVYHGGLGGYFIWIKIDSKYDLPKIVATLKNDHNIILASGDNFEVVEDKQGWSNCIRLCYSFLTPEEIEYGIKVWGSLLES